FPIPSFNIISKINTHKLTNTINQTNHKLSTHLNFKNIKTKFILKNNIINQSTPNNFQLQQITNILHTHLITHNINI
ncbi:DUF520 family protein, partial [Xanthomonas citri pv. citri]|nr:DUF520 family protein [Xanthomonas citri pv. citri]